MRTRPGSSGVKSSVLPPSVFVKRSVMRCASSPMRDNETRCADNETRALGPVQVSGRRDDRDIRLIGTDQKRQPFAHRVDASRAEPWTGTDQRNLCAANPPARLRSLAERLAEQLGAVDTPGSWIRRREEAAQVTQAGGRKNGRRRCMQYDIAVGVTVQSRRILDDDAAETQADVRS